MEKTGGFWLTPDLSLNRETFDMLFAEDRVKAIDYIKRLIGLNMYEDNLFAADADAEKFYVGEGFRIERHCEMADMSSELQNLKNAGLNLDIAERRMEGIKATTNVWALELRK